MLQAIIDIGSNTIRMAIYQLHGDRADLLLKKKNLAALAAHVQNGVMQPSGIERAAQVLTEFQDFLRALGIRRVTAFATAALRNAVNSREAVAAIERRTGLSLRVLSGDEEAELGFLGATHDLPTDSGLLVDIGGGSTELVRYEARQITARESLPIGSQQLASRFVRGVLPTPDEAIRLSDEAERQALLLPASSFPVACGIGGTLKGAKNLYHAAQNCAVKKRTAKSGAKAPRAADGSAAANPPENSPVVATHIAKKHAFPMSALSEMIARFISAGDIPEDDLALLLKTEPDRIHTLIPGLILARALFSRLGTETVIYSDSGVREGFLYREILPGVR